VKAALPLLTLAAGATLLQGCAAAIPGVAAAAIARQRVASGDHGAEQQPAAPTDATSSLTYVGPVGSVPGTMPAPPGMQYLYGSGEAAALSLQTFRALDSYLMARASDRSVGHEVTSVVLAKGSTLAEPVFETCDGKPLAVVLDVDETAILNLGFEADQAKRGGAYDQQRWLRWERTGGDKVVPVPGALDAVEIARKAGVTVIFNSNRTMGNAEATAAMLEAAGFGDVTVGDTLWLAGPDESGKDARRWRISQKYCVIAQVGDQLGDFTDLFNTATSNVSLRRASVAGREVEWLWGLGWFLLPNPVYGSALKGSLDEVFPADTQWTDPADTASAPAATTTNGSVN
jgi:5'-nucleotidase (lipoprotein e(P4) family)